MQNLKEITTKLLPLFGFKEASVEIDEEKKRVSLKIDDGTINAKNMPALINAFNRVLKLIAKKYDEGPITVDVNNHHREREKLVVELAKAGAKKAATTKGDVVLPPMNAFERHLVHEEISVRPDLKTESVGEGQSRRVVIKFIG
ncbi:MAG: R3H domain-containing nucleic acid-binding protein [Parcubacteria group bacterium]